MISAEDAIDYGITGPALRGSGVDWDLRRDNPYSGYEKYSFKVPVGEKCDTFDRYKVRLVEMREAVNIITQALKDLGPVPGGLLLVHLPSMGMDDRKRLRLLVEPLAGRAPFVLVGTDVENAPLFELGKELKATASYVLGPNPGSFFPRLLQGILRKHFGVGTPEEASPGDGPG